MSLYLYTLNQPFRWKYGTQPPTTESLFKLPHTRTKLHIGYNDITPNHPLYPKTMACVCLLKKGQNYYEGHYATYNRKYNSYLCNCFGLSQELGSTGTVSILLNGSDCYTFSLLRFY